MSIDLTKKTTQAKFAQLVGVTQPVISGLLMRGVLTSGDTAGNWLLAYCGHMREAASGRAERARSPDENGLIWEVEKARLAAAQADKIEMENAVTRGDLASVDIIQHVLTRAAAKVAAVFDAMPSILKRRLPDITDTDMLVFRVELAKARNAVANMSLEDVEAEEDDEAE